MKLLLKTIAFMTAILMATSICGCSKKVENNKNTDSKTTEKNDLTEITMNDIKLLNVKREPESGNVPGKSLNNTLYKLKNDKKLTVGYLGGSVTCGTGASSDSTAWRSVVTGWLKDSYKDAEITEVNAGIGGSGSMYDLFRAEKDLLSKKPDLIFIESVINDSYNKNNGEQSGFFVESILSHIYKNNPYADVILVFVTDKGARGKETQFTTAQKELAAHYGIPYIDAGAGMLAAVGDAGIDDMFKDWAHPNDKGHAQYATVVEKSLSDMLNASSADYKKQEIPKNLYSNLLVNADLINFDDSFAKKTENWKYVARNGGGVPSGLIFTAKKDAEFTLEFSGTVLGAYINSSKTGSKKVEFIIDDTYISTVSMYDSGDGGSAILIADGLKDGKHTLRVVNKSGGRCSISQILFA